MTAAVSRARALALALVVSAALLLSPTAATAAVLPLTTRGAEQASFSFSSDGEAFSAAVPVLFADAPKLVPGESIDKELWVRNDNDSSYHVSLGAQSAELLGDKNEVRLSSSSVLSLEPGEMGVLQLRLSLPELADNTSQGRRWHVGLRFQTSEMVPVRNTELGHTGGISAAWQVAILTLLGGCGLLWGTRSRKSSRTVGEET